MPWLAESVAQRRDKSRQVVDRIGEFREVTADDVRGMAVAGAGRPHRVPRQKSCGLPASLGSDVIADQFERVERRAVFGHDRLEVLIPTKRMRGDDRRAVSAHDLEEVFEKNPRPGLREVGQAVDQKMSLARRDLGPAQDLEADGIAPTRQFSEFVGPPLVVMFGDDDPVEPRRAGAAEKLQRVDVAVGRVSRRVDVVIEPGHGVKTSGVAVPIRSDQGRSNLRLDDECRALVIHSKVACAVMPAAEDDEPGGPSVLVQGFMDVTEDRDVDAGG